MKRQLPPRADLQQLKTQAKELLKAHDAGDPDALARVREAHPRFAKASSVDAGALKLSDAQLVLAREYGFASWPALKNHVESIVPEPVDLHAEVKQAFAS